MSALASWLKWRPFQWNCFYIPSGNVDRHYVWPRNDTPTEPEFYATFWEDIASVNSSWLILSASISSFLKMEDSLSYHRWYRWRLFYRNSFEILYGNDICKVLSSNGRTKSRRISLAVLTWSVKYAYSLRHRLRYDDLKTRKRADVWLDTNTFSMIDALQN